MTLFYTTDESKEMVTVENVGTIDYSKIHDNKLYYFTRNDGGSVLHEVEHIDWLSVENI